MNVASTADMALEKFSAVRKGKYYSISRTGVCFLFVYLQGYVKERVHTGLLTRYLVSLTLHDIDNNVRKELWSNGVLKELPRSTDPGH